MKLAQKARIKVNQSILGGLAIAEKLAHGNSLNLFSAAYLTDPHGEFASVRERGPLFYSMAVRAWWATSFEVVQEVLRDPRFGADVRKIDKRAARIRKQLSDDLHRLEGFENPSMLNLDPPDHTRIRRLATHAFMRNYIASLEPGIERIVDKCLDRIGNQPTFDAIEVLAKPVPAIVIADMMGLPESDHAQFQAWSEDLIEGTATNDLGVIERAMASNRALIEYFRGIIEQRRGQNSDDLIGQLIAAEEEGDKLNARELYNTCLLLLVAGHETTTRLIGNGLYLLLRSPDQLARLRTDPGRIPNAIEEMLRFEPPVMATQRFVLEDMDFHGQALKRGDAIFVGLAAANRDPAANDHPDTFDTTRDKVNLVSFGYGIHLCIGAALARLEGKVAFARLFERFPDLALEEEPTWGRNPFFRGFDHLSVRTAVAPVATGTSA